MKKKKRFDPPSRVLIGIVVILLLVFASVVAVFGAAQNLKAQLAQNFLPCGGFGEICPVTIDPGTGLCQKTSFSSDVFVTTSHQCGEGSCMAVCVISKNAPAAPAPVAASAKHKTAVKAQGQRAAKKKK